MADKEPQRTVVQAQEEEKSLTDHLNKTLLESFMKRINLEESDVPKFENKGEEDDQWRDGSAELGNQQNGTL